MILEREWYHHQGRGSNMTKYDQHEHFAFRHISTCANCLAELAVLSPEQDVQFRRPRIQRLICRGC